jgi:hypothetical protein
VLTRAAAPFGLLAAQRGLLRLRFPRRLYRHPPDFVSHRQRAFAHGGATALALVGLANIFGSSLFGWLGDRYRKNTS